MPDTRGEYGGSLATATDGGAPATASESRLEHGPLSAPVLLRQGRVIEKPAQRRAYLTSVFRLFQNPMVAVIVYENTYPASQPLAVLEVVAHRESAPQLKAKGPVCCSVALFNVPVLCYKRRSS